MEGCFICLSVGVTLFRLNGKKLDKENFFSKLRGCFLDISSHSSLKKAFVCRKCYRRSINVFNFVDEIKKRCQLFLQNDVQSAKRGPSSPICSDVPAKLQILEKNVGIGDLCATVDRRCYGVAGAKDVLKIREHMCDELDESVDVHGLSGIKGQPISDENDYAENKLKELHGGASDDLGDHSYVSCAPSMIKGQSVPDALERLLLTQETDPSKHKLLQEMRIQASDLMSTNADTSSVLYKYRNINELMENSHKLLHDIVLEMKTRIPFLLEVLCTVAVPANGKISSTIIPVIASCYSILMKHRWDNLSAFHRLTTAIAIKAGLDERGQTRLNHLGLALSAQRRFKFQESAHKSISSLIIDALKSNPLIKITGDNLDIYVKTSNLSSEKRNKDLHMFTSNVIFSRVATTDMNNEQPKVNVTSLTADDVLLSGNMPQREKLIDAYSTLLGRILFQIPFFSVHSKLVPNHIPHEFTKKMCKKSLVFPLPIQFKNETKHEDCLSIMDNYEEELKSLFTSAFGNADLLRKFKVPVGGDQLTRIRLQEAKNLRILSTTPEKHFDDLHPIVCELWHSKQDLLEKCYNALYKTENTPGTLYYFKTILHRSNVNGNVKSRFQPHMDLLLAVGECLVREQFMEFFSMNDKISEPQHALLIDMGKKSNDERKHTLKCIIREFITKYGYGTIDSQQKQNSKQKRYKLTVTGNQVVIQPLPEEIQEEDELMNYCTQLCHWFLQIQEMNDTAKEGDLNRAVLNCKYSIPFFYSHSPLSKYMVENIDYVLKVEHLLSPLQRIRVLEGSFTNTKGGKGNNVESDLCQEHSVCNQKGLIKQLGANKSEQAISRITSSADTLAEICSKFDESVHIKPKSSRHSKAISQADYDTIYKTLRRLRPFKYTPGRKCEGFQKVKQTPVKNLEDMKERVNVVINRLTRGQVVLTDDGDDEDDLDDFYEPEP